MKKIFSRILLRGKFDLVLNKELYLKMKISDKVVTAFFKEEIH